MQAGGIGMGIGATGAVGATPTGEGLAAGGFHQSAVAPASLDRAVRHRQLHGVHGLAHALAEFSSAEIILALLLSGAIRKQDDLQVGGGAFTLLLGAALANSVALTLHRAIDADLSAYRGNQNSVSAVGATLNVQA